MDDDRPSWESIWMQLAWTLSERSTCARLKVGCVIVTEDNCHVLALGYNGNYALGPNECDSDKPGRCGCLHAECNSLLKLRYTGGQIKIAYITHVPCRACAKMLVNAGVDRVVYQEKYRDMTSLKILDDAGLGVERYEVET